MVIQTKFDDSSLDKAPNFDRFADDGERCLMGIDEAGRGPVLGPMVYACAVVRESCADKLLKQIGVTDSKALTESKRESMFEQMSSLETSAITYVYRALSAQLISACMLRRIKCSLNELSYRSAIDLIQAALDAQINIGHVFVDTVGPPETYQLKLEQLFPSLSITVSKKADSIYPIVGAASIVAKVNRDRLLKQWTFVEGDDVVTVGGDGAYGSGYPGDPQTKSFIVDSIDPIFGYSSLVRFSWKTAQRALDLYAAKCTWDNDDEMTNRKSSVLRFCSKSNNTNGTITQPSAPALVRHMFFTDRCISSVGEL